MSSVSSVHDKFLVPWARKVQAESNGRIRIDIFPSMQLGGAPAHLFDQARDGDADIVWTAPSLTPGRFPKIEMFDLPFVPSRRALVSFQGAAGFRRGQSERRVSRRPSDLLFVHRSRRDPRQCADPHDRGHQGSENSRADALGRRGACMLLGAQPVPMPSGQLAARGQSTRHRRLRRSLAPDAGAAAQRSAQDAHGIFRPVAEQHDLRAGDE